MPSRTDHERQELKAAFTHHINTPYHIPLTHTLTPSLSIYVPSRTDHERQELQAAFTHSINTPYHTSYQHTLSCHILSHTLTHTLTPSLSIYVPSRTDHERQELQAALDREAGDKRIIEEQKTKLGDPPLSDPVVYTLR